ncbi:MAG: trypsin-like peptidase domain-containing protein [Clostridia bacterium]|nr:trypsin-like peptidase domain-containing protein [Clostridia bacterium]
MENTPGINLPEENVPTPNTEPAPATQSTSEPAPQSAPETSYTWQNPSPYTNSSTYTGYTGYTPPKQEKKPKPPKAKKNGTQAALIIMGSFIAVLLIVIFALLTILFVDGVMALGDDTTNGQITQDETENNETADKGEKEENKNLPALDTKLPTTDARTIPQIYQKVKESVVGIVVTAMDSTTGQIGQGSGTGIILSEDGYISTNAHVVNGVTTIKVFLNDKTEYDAELIGIDTKTDLAVLKIEAKDLKPAEIGDSDALVQGETVVAIGNPYGLELAGTVTAGIVSALDREMVIENVYMTLIQTDASINPGNSGGPLVNGYGQVIGITSSKIITTGYEGIGFAIPITGATEIISELIEYGYIKNRPSIGIMGRNIDESYAKFYSIPEGVYVEYVSPDSDAHKKGLKKGDIITGVNGKEIDSMAALDAEKNKYKPGESITLNVFRNSKKLEITVVLSESTEE